MVRRKKDQPPMKYRGFYCPDDLWAEMQRCAEIADESDSEYIRKAVEMRNKQYPHMVYNGQTFEKVVPEKADRTHKNNTEEAYRDRIHDRAKQIIENNAESNQSICESIQKSINEDIHNGKCEDVKPYQPKSSMVKPLPKGGGKK